jgi:hypothetical protein
MVTWFAMWFVSWSLEMHLLLLLMYDCFLFSMTSDFETIGIWLLEAANENLFEWF